MTQLLKAIQFTERIAQGVIARIGMEPPRLVVSPAKGNTVEGECEVQRFRPNMFVRVFLPWDLKFDAKTKAAIIAVTIHEFSHFEYAYPQNAMDRHRDGERYEDDGEYRRYDERRTWKRTRQLMKEMGLWCPQLRRECRTYGQASVI